MYFDPAYQDLLGPKTALNRATGSLCAADWNTGAARVTDVPSGQPLIYSEQINSEYFQIQGDQAFNLAAWSFFTVCRNDPANTTPARRYLIQGNTDHDSGLSPAVAIAPSSGNLIVYERSNDVSGIPQRLSYAGALRSRSALSLLMVTFSSRDGLRVFDNGTLVAAAPSDQRALTVNAGANEYKLFRYFRGWVGVSGLLGLDLGWSENSGYRRLIESYILAKYKLSGS
jgi:hypothetical protein